MMTVGALRRVPVRIRWHHTLSVQIRTDNERESWVSSVFGNLRTRLFFRFATHAVANSDAAKDDLIRSFGVPERKCHVFWNALDDPLANFTNGQVPAIGENGHVRFVCAGRFSPSKGQDVLLRAISQAVRRLPGIKVEFIGDGPARHSCENLAAELGITSHCCFIGKLPHAEVLRRMAGARATIVPSRTEAFGLVNIESMSLGVPVIGSNTGGISEIVRDGIDGLLFTPGDHKSLGRRMLDMAQDDFLHTRLGASSRTRFLESFELSRAVKAQADWISQLVNASTQLCREPRL
jgi:glycosyltransferase involved in cell wall biosynthesis